MMNLTKQSLEDLKGVITALEHLKDSSCIILADCPNVLVQKQVRNEIERALNGDEFRFREIRLSTEGSRNIPNLILEQNPELGDIFFVYNFRDLLPGSFLQVKDWPEAIQMLNLKREVFVDKKVSAIFWLDSETIKAIARRAPDFWAFRTLVVEFEPEEKGEPIPYEGVTITIPTAQEREDAIALKESLMRKLNKDSPDYWRKASILYSELGALYFEKSDLEKALENFMKDLQISERVDQPGGIARAYGNIGIVLAHKGDLEGALENYRKALEINERTDNLEAMASNYGNIGNVLFQKGDMGGALEDFGKSLEISNKLALHEFSANQYNNIGQVFFLRGDLEAALKNYGKSLEINRRIKNLQGIAKNYGNIGIVLYRKGDIEGALENYRKVLESLKKIGNLDGIATTYANIGNVLAGKGDLQGALEYYNKSLEITEKIGLDPISANQYINIANIHFHRGNYQLSAFLQLQALLLFHRFGMTRELEIARAKLGISIGKLKEQGKFEDFLEEAKKQFGEEVSQQLEAVVV